MTWTNLERPGYFGRRRDEIIHRLNREYDDRWRLVWIVEDQAYEFEAACKLFYEEAYFQYLSQRPKDVDKICKYGECIDNAPSNVRSGCDYTKQEAYSTHIQDIAVRNVLKRLDRKFEGPPSKILTIRSADSNGYWLGPGNIPFHRPDLITQPSLAPRWANKNSVEDYHQSNKWLQVKAQADG